MNLLPQLIAYLARATMQDEKPICTLWLRSLGGLLFTCGLGLGAYFLFPFLIPILGYVESGLAISGVFLILGICLLYLKPRRRTNPTSDMLLRAKNTIENINIPLQLEKNATKLVVGAICVGFILSQLVGSKKN